MSTDQPFDSLGRILSEGGEIALGLAIIRGWSDSQIIELFARRFSGLSSAETERLSSMANAAIRGARIANDLDPSDPFPLSSLPVNPELFGDEFSGKRSFFIGEVWNPMKEHWIEIRMEFPGVPTLNEVNEKLFGEARRRFGESPDRLGTLPEEDDFQLQGRIIFQERRF